MGRIGILVFRMIFKFSSKLRAKVITLDVDAADTIEIVKDN